MKVESESYVVEREGFLPRQDSGLALSNFKDKFVFIIGGNSSKDVLRYHVDPNQR